MLSYYSRTVGRCFQYDPTSKTTSALFDLTDNRKGSGSEDWSYMTVMGMTMIAGSDRHLVFGVPIARTKGKVVIVAGYSVFHRFREA
jgi:hypothetical protein